MDHIAGVPELKQKYSPEIVGPKYDLARIPDIDVALEEGDTYQLGEETAEVFFTPGHTSGHIVYHFPDSHVLLSGDTLFSLGCGRVFEGTPEELWGGLKKLRDLPDETMIYCGHEYTLANAKFALSVDPDNEALKAQAAEVEEKRAGNEPTIPAPLGREKRTNPFLRADDPALMAAMDMAGSDAVSVFAAVRRAKDNF
jgi:hydroxyacylglutathione hydrolase